METFHDCVVKIVADFLLKLTWVRFTPYELTAFRFLYCLTTRDLTICAPVRCVVGMLKFVAKALRSRAPPGLSAQGTGSTAFAWRSAGAAA